MRVHTSDDAFVVFEDRHVSGLARSGELPIVLLHGLSQQRHYWDPVIARLRGGRVITVDQRGHGEASVDPDGNDVPIDLDFSMDRLAADVIEVLDALEIPAAIVVGHSWGASIALHVAARYPGRIRACALIDGGLFGPRHLVDRAGTHQEVREALRPPPLGMLPPVLWEAIATGDLAPYWGTEVRSALEPTFRTDELGRIFTRLGMERHMAVLDGLFDYDPVADISDVGCPVWIVVCEQPSSAEDLDDPVSEAWREARSRALTDLPAPFFVQRWYRALHDVPLQWPALVAGLLETIAERTRA